MCDIYNMKKDLNRVHKLMVSMKAEKNEIRSILNSIDSELKKHDEGEDYLRMAREYYIKAMERL